MTKHEVIAYLFAADIDTFNDVIETATAVRAIEEKRLADAAPKKPGPKPGSKRKRKLNGAPAQTCEKHGIALTMYANGLACGKCALEGVQLDTASH